MRRNSIMKKIYQKFKTKMKKTNLKSNSGFTLVEMIAVVAVFAIVVVTTADLFITITKVAKSTNMARKVYQDARYALETISQEARAAKSLNIDEINNIITITSKDDAQSKFERSFGIVTMTNLPDEPAKNLTSVDATYVTVFEVDDTAFSNGLDNIQPFFKLTIEAQSKEPDPEGDNPKIRLETLISKRNYGGEAGVSLWKFDEGSGTIAGDSIGINDGTLKYDYDGGNEQVGDGVTNGPIWTNDAHSGGYALRFNRGAISETGDFVRVPNSASLNISGDLTIDFWAKFPDDLDSRQAMVGKCEYYASYSIRINQDALGSRRVSFKFEAVGKSWLGFDPDELPGLVEPYRYVVTNNNVEINNTDWFHIVAVKDGTEMKLYVNDDEAVLTDVVPYNDDPEEFLNRHDLFLGGDPHDLSPPGTLDYPFDGIIDEVRIYKTAL